MTRDQQRLVDYLTHIVEAIERFAATHPELPLSFAYQMCDAQVREALTSIPGRGIEGMGP